MPKYLCNTTIRSAVGEVVFEFGLVYDGRAQRGGRSIESMVSCRESTDGAHNAFELVEAEWPEEIGIHANTQIMQLRHHASGSNARLNFDGRIITKFEVARINKFTTEWLEAAESESP